MGDAAKSPGKRSCTLTLMIQCMSTTSLDATSPLASVDMVVAALMLERPHPEASAPTAVPAQGRPISGHLVGALHHCLVAVRRPLATSATHHQRLSVVFVGKSRS